MKINYTSILKAVNSISRYINPTPLVYSQTLSELTGGNVYLKLECLQEIGTFKIRGAINKLTSLSEEDKCKGVITASAGNHAQAVAKVSTMLGIDSLIVVPESAPETKIKKTKQYGGKVLVKGSIYNESAEIAKEIQRTTGRTFVHAFKDPEVMAGQGTIGHEILSELPETDYIISPVGGSGIITGIATAAKAMNPFTKTIGVQSYNSRPWYETFHKKEYVPVIIGDTWADGLAGDLNKDLIEDFLKTIDDMLVVEEDSIKHAMYWLLDNHHIIGEGAGVVGIASLLTKQIDVSNKTAVVVVTGSNADSEKIKVVLNELCN